MGQFGRRRGRLRTLYAHGDHEGQAHKDNSEERDDLGAPGCALGLGSATVRAGRRLCADILAAFFAFRDSHVWCPNVAWLLAPTATAVLVVEKPLPTNLAEVADLLAIEVFVVKVPAGKK